MRLTSGFARIASSWEPAKDYTEVVSNILSSQPQRRHRMVYCREERRGFPCWDTNTTAPNRLYARQLLCMLTCPDKHNVGVHTRQ